MVCHDATAIEAVSTENRGKESEEMKPRPLIFKKEYCLVPLSQGQFAIIDKEDAPLIGAHNWRLKARRAVTGERALCMGRFVSKDPKGLRVVHKNENLLDNRKENLKLGTSSKVGGGSRKKAAASSIHKGVCLDKRRRKWIARIKFKRKYYWLGYFALEVDAARAYNMRAKVLFKDFARLNNL